MKQLAYFVIGLGIGFLTCKIFFQAEETKEKSEIEIVKPKGVITPEEAVKLDRNFNKKHEVINNALGIVDNRSSWYSLTDIKNYLVYAENQVSELKYRMDGIRIYVGSHEEDSLTTMFIVPTGTPMETPNVKNLLPPSSNDILGGDGLNGGGEGVPPDHNYPQ